MAALSSLHMFALVRHNVVVSTAAYIHRLLSDNEHDIQPNTTTALAIVRTSAPRETAMALKLSAVIVIVECERTVPLLLGPTCRPSILYLPNHHPNELFVSIFVLQV
jgi:hypothetical protein